MVSLYWLTDAQMERPKLLFPKSHDKPRADERRVLRGIIFISHNGLRWCDAPKEYGPSKTIYNRWRRWSDNGVFARIMVGLDAERAEHKTIMIDATYLKAHRTAASLGGEKGGDYPSAASIEARSAQGDQVITRCQISALTAANRLRFLEDRK
jgi:transposase